MERNGKINTATAAEFATDFHQHFKILLKCKTNTSIDLVPVSERADIEEKTYEGAQYPRTGQS